MSLIFDTSIWIEYLKGKENYFDACHQLIERGEVFTIEIIFADMIKSYFNLIPKINIPQLYIQAADFSRNEILYAKGIGLIDASIIKATIESKSKLWTLDKKIISFLGNEFLFGGN